MMCACTSLLSLILPINLLLLCRWQLDIQNKWLPKFNPDIALTMFLGPSMHHGSTDSGMELLIKKTLEEEGEEGSVVEQIAEKIARGRRITERPAALRRHGTV
jgi:serine/threonine-protein phosphatase 2B catalytic subunit